MDYYSQCGQDKYLNENIFFGKKQGFFLDIGAHNGITFSNTLFFEKYLQWNGICVEPLPQVYKELVENRHSICINACVAHFDGKSTLQKIDGYSEMLSFLTNYSDSRHLHRIDYELNIYGGTKSLLEVDCITVNHLLENNRMKEIDFCSIDTEGGELEILRVIDFKRFPIDIMVVENNYPNDLSICRFMESQGYHQIKILGGDEIYQFQN